MKSHLKRPAMPISIGEMCPPAEDSAAAGVLGNTSIVRLLARDGSSGEPAPQTAR